MRENFGSFQYTNMCMNKMRFNMVLEHWKDRHHDLILGNKTPHSTFVPLNSRNQMRMNTSNLNINIKS